MDAGVIEPHNTGIFLAAWLESALEETTGREEGRLGKAGIARRKRWSAARRHPSLLPPLCGIAGRR